MRVRSGNPYGEVHGSTRTYEFIADSTKTAAEICAAAETATGLRLRGDPTGQDGYINTRLNPDGSRFVAVVLYEACAGCADHSIPHRRAADIDPVKQAAMKTACNEHPQHKLTGNPAADAAKLRALGFKDNDPALRNG